MYQEVSRSQENSNKGSPNPNNTPVLPVSYRRQQYETGPSGKGTDDVDPLNISDVDCFPIQANLAIDNYVLSQAADPKVIQQRGNQAVPTPVQGREIVATTREKSDTLGAGNNRDRVMLDKHIVDDDHQTENDFFDQIIVDKTNDKVSANTPREIGREGAGRGQKSKTRVQENDGKEAIQNGTNSLSVIADHERQLLELREQVKGKLLIYISNFSFIYQYFFVLNALP